MNDLIKINKENDRITVLGRDLHKFLELKEDYTEWIVRMISYGFEENTDFYVFSEISETTDNTAFGGIRKTKLSNHQLTLDMAKEISMIQRNEKGKQARQYFIECEKKLNKPMSLLEIAQFSINKLVEQEKEIKQLDNRITAIESKQINSPYEFFSVVAYCNLKGLKCELKQAIQWGKAASKLSKDLGVKMGNTPDPRFGQVNTYHIEILDNIIQSQEEY